MDNKAKMYDNICESYANKIHGEDNIEVIKEIVQEIYNLGFEDGHKHIAAVMGWDKREAKREANEDFSYTVTTASTDLGEQYEYLRPYEGEK